MKNRIPLQTAASMLALVAALAATPVRAEVVNIGTQIAQNSYVVDLGGGVTGVGSLLTLAAGSYEIVPLDQHAGGAYTAANRFNNVALPYRGWEWNYFIAIDGQPATKIGFGGGQPAADGNYQATAGAAFALAPTYDFSLSSTSSVALYWADDVFSDNAGGISVAVSSVPEPAGGALLAAGLGMVLAGLRLRGVLRWR